MRTHTEPGDEVILERSSHAFLYEGGGFAAISGLSAWCLDAPRGILSAEQIEAAIRPLASLSHFPRTRLIWLENSHNRAGGTIYGLQAMAEIEALAARFELRTHLDGARAFNAATALGLSIATVVAPFDSVSICLSKGLGCPVGSVLAGSRSFIDRAHRFRKMLGGGMRQAGILAAAGLHALDHHVEGLAEDHRRARSLAEGWAALPGIRVDLETVQTNLVYADILQTGHRAEDLLEFLERGGVRIVAVGETQVRAVTHLDVDDAGIDATLRLTREWIERL